MIEQMTRYKRQENLPEIGHEGQQKIAAAAVLVVGAGGLGAPALQYLAGAGVGHIGIVDHDIVDISNLHRQTIYETVQEGMAKADAAAEYLEALNPEINIQAYKQKFSPDLLQGYDLVIDGTDNFDTKFLISDACVAYDKPLIYGSVQGFEGQIALLNAGLDSPCYRCLYPAPPKSRIMNCAEAGVLGPVAGIVGVMQALEALKFIAGLPSLSGKLWLWDGKTHQARIFDIPKNPACPACSGAAPIQETSIIIPEIGPEDAFLNDAVFIDVREEQEWANGIIEGAALFALSDLLDNPQGFEIDPGDKPLVLYCQKGIRSLTAGEILKARGYTDIYSLKGGYAAWKQGR